MTLEERIRKLIQEQREAFVDDPYAGQYANGVYVGVHSVVDELEEILKEATK